MKLIFGLGNPSWFFRQTRHNVGQMAVSRITTASALRWQKKATYAYASYRSNVVLIRSRISINRSGIVAREAIADFQSAPEKLLAIHDDIAFDLGRIKLQFGGQHAGHNGIRSIIDALQTDRFERIRMGIGAAAPGRSLLFHVLMPFRREEKANLSTMLALTCQAVDNILTKDFRTAQNIFNA